MVQVYDSFKFKKKRERRPLYYIIHKLKKKFNYFPVIPVIKEKPKVIKIVKKKTVIVECTVLSKFAPDCTWFKETKAVTEDDRHKLHVEKIKEGEFAVKLEIEQISQADKGKYKLVARNEKGEATSQVVEIQEIAEEPDPPRLASGLKSLVSLCFVFFFICIDKT